MAMRLINEWLSIRRKIKIECDKCNKLMKKKGAILWSPPDKDEMCKKTHLCRGCYKIVFDSIIK